MGVICRFRVQFALTHINIDSCVNQQLHNLPAEDASFVSGVADSNTGPHVFEHDDILIAIMKSFSRRSSAPADA